MDGCEHRLKQARAERQPLTPEERKKAQQILDKAKRYGWTVKDKKGELQYVTKTLLKVDHRYQRTVKIEKTRRMARAWSWNACAAIAVARRPDGSLWIMDGVHRHAAPMLRGDIHDLPCIIFNVEAIKQEAQGFLDIQLERRSVKPRSSMRCSVLATRPLGSSTS